MGQPMMGQWRRNAAALVGAVLLAVPAGLEAQASGPGTTGAGQQGTSTADAIRLPELVITAAGFEQSKLAAPASITVLSSTELMVRRATSLAEVLMTVEGIDVGGTAGKTGGLNVSMRGMPSDYTLVLIDGRRQNTAGNVTPNGFGETATSFLPPLSAIERVEIIRGPVATLYGSDAMGGVVNIITKRGAPSWSGSFTTDATLQQNDEFGNTYSGSGLLRGPLVPGLASLTVRGSRLHREASSLTPTGEHGGQAISQRGPSPVQADNHALGARLSVFPSAAHDLVAEFDVSRQRYDNATGQLGTLDNLAGTPAVVGGYGPQVRFNRDQASVSHTWRLGSATLNSSLMRNVTETVGRTIPNGTPGGLPGSGTPNKEPGSARTLESENLVFDSKLTSALERHVVSAGVQYWDATMVDGVALVPFEFTQWAVFAENEWRVASDVALTVGVRRDDHTSFGAHVSPRAYAVWQLAQDWTVKGGVSRGYKTPRVEQLVDGIIGFTAQGRTATIGSPRLRPETSTSTEVGATFAPTSGFTAGMTLFNNEFRDKIASGTPVPNCTFRAAPDLPGCVNHGEFPTQEHFAQSVNIDRARTWGAEFSARVPVGDKVSASGNYTFTRSKQLSGDSEGMPLSNTPRHMVNGELRATATDRLNTWVRGEYRSERARRTSVAANPAWESLGDFRAFGLAHLGAGYDLGRGVTLNATLQNVFDKDFLRYEAYQGTPTAENPSGVMYTNVYNNHQEGRRLWLSTTVQF